MNSKYILYSFITLSFICVINSSSLVAQSKKVRRCLDTIQTLENEHINTYNYDNFYGIGEINDKIDPKSINQSLMDASVFFAVNLMRKKYKKSILVHSQKLYKFALMYTIMHSSNAFDEAKDDISAKTIIKYAASRFDYECALIEAKVSLNTIMEIEKNGAYHFDKPNYVSGESEYGLYHGPIELKFDSTIIRKEIDFLTYEKFAKNVAKQYLKIIKSEKRKHNWTEGSCSVTIDKKSLFSSKLPQAKIIFIFAKKRTALLPAN